MGAECNRAAPRATAWNLLRSMLHRIAVAGARGAEAVIGARGSFGGETNLRGARQRAGAVLL